MRSGSWVSDDTPPVNTEPSAEQTVLVYFGDTADMSITATHAETYQWYVDRGDGQSFVPIPNAADPNYTTPPVTTDSDGYVYRCVVTNAYGQAISPTFTLKVLNMPKTGDDSPLWVWLGLMMLSFAGLIVCAAVRRRNDRCSHEG